MKRFFFTILLRFFRLPKSTVPTNQKGLVIILIDGLSYSVLYQAINNGFCPFLKELTTKQGFKLHSYFCGIPSVTTATQAQLFFGNRNNIPGFSWYDRKLKQFIRGSSGEQIQSFENSIAENKNSLLKNGSCVVSIYSAGATMCSISGKDITTKHILRPLSKLYLVLLFLTNPLRLLLFFWVVSKILFIGITHIVKLGPHNYRLKISEVFSKFFFGNLAHYLAGVEIFRETPVLFVNYLFYDEIAHQHGVKTSIAFSTLRIIDSYCKSLYKATTQSKRPYSFIIMSDHGQSASVPFEHFSGTTVAQFLTETMKPQKRICIQTFKNQLNDNAQEDKNVYIVPSGNCANLYFPERYTNPYTEHELNQLFPNLIPQLLHNKGIGWVLVRIDRTKQKLISKKGYAVFEDKKVIKLEGNLFENIISEEARILESLANYASFWNNGDLVLFGNNIHDKIISFEDHKGTHGGFLAEMVYPFILTKEKPIIDQLEKNNEMSLVFSKIHRLRNI